MSVHILVPLAVLAFLKDERHAVQDRMTDISQHFSRVWESQSSTTSTSASEPSLQARRARVIAVAPYRTPSTDA